MVRNSSVVLLAERTLPVNNFIHLYETIPYTIMIVNEVANLRCNDYYKTI